MTSCSIQRCILTLFMGALMLGGCASSLWPKPQATQVLFTLDVAVCDAVSQPTGNQPDATRPTLIVSPVRAAPQVDTASMAYQRHPGEIEYFNESRWVAPPADMLAPIIARAARRSGAFAAVVGAPTSAAGQLRLDIDLVRLQQEFIGSTSQVRLILHATLIDTSTRRVVGSREIEAQVPSRSADASGGAVAAGIALSRVLNELTAFCSDAAQP